MRRIVVVAVAAAAFGAPLLVGSGSPGVVAQDGDTATLQTRVAALETAVAGLAGETPDPEDEADPTATARSSVTPTPDRTELDILVRSPTGTAEVDDDGPADAAGTREAPIPLRTEADAGGGWQVAVLDADADATEEILAENQFNEAPEEGSRFFTIRVSATFTGPGSASVLDGLRFQAVGVSAVAYDSAASCGVIPDELPLTEVFEGGTIEGDVCFAVAEEDVDSLLLFTDSYVTLDDEDRVYYSLRGAR